MRSDIEYSLNQTWEVDLGIRNVDIIRFLNDRFPKKKSYKRIWGRFCFSGKNLGISGNVLRVRKRFCMRKKGYKGRCEKRVIGKCEGVCRTYDPIQSAYADILQQDDRVVKFQCNVLLEGLVEGEYTSDFVCTKVEGELLVRECVQRKHLLKPMTVKLLDASREYWKQHG